MLEVDEAIFEIKKALIEYGTDIKYKTIGLGTYNPLLGSSETTITEIDTKALFKPNITISPDFTSDYDLSIILLLDTPPSKVDKVLYENEEYEIVKINAFTLQNKVFKYELQLKK